MPQPVSKITVLGAAGRTGRHVLALAARRGMPVTVLTRRPHLLASREGLDRVITGDGTDPAAVRDAVTGAGTVVAIIGASSPRGPHQIAAVTRVLIPAMTGAGVSRLVITSAYPVVAVKPRLVIGLLRFMLADAYADAADMEQIVSGQAGLAWTIARLSRLTDGPARGGTRISRELLTRPSAITRADAAAALLDIAADASLAAAAVNVAGPAPRSRVRTGEPA